MSISLTAVEQIEFDALVKAVYQSSGHLLRGAARTRTDVTGRTIEFRKVGQVQSVETGYMQAVTIQDPNYDKVSATLRKYTTPTGVDSVQELTVNFSTKMENAMLVAKAMGRRCDQIDIDALDADPGETIVDGGTNFTYGKFTQVYEYFEDNAVPKGDRFLALSANNLRSLMGDDQFVSTFYTQNRILDRGYILEYLGINVITIPQMNEGGLPKAGNIRSAFAWHKDALGMAYGHDLRTEINYIPEKTTWLINGLFSAGAVVIDNTGVFQIDCDESA